MGFSFAGISVYCLVSFIIEFFLGESGSGIDEDAAEADQSNVANLPPGTRTTYQAASPDEVALAQWSTSMGLSLIERSNNSIKLKTEAGKLLSFTIMQIFPFTSEKKRMGIILRVSFGFDNFYMLFST